ncbi:hypothetical protein [Parafrankia colletiae]
MCTRCADMCAKMPDDPQMAACAEACRRAAAACQKLAAAN